MMKKSSSFRLKIEEKMLLEKVSVNSAILSDNEKKIVQNLIARSNRSVASPPSARRATRISALVSTAHNHQVAIGPSDGVCPACGRSLP
ncbi:MAG: hypothetical protein NT007_19040 [Candidatus Kapabacteria bacterium]|nr:hypothetical protein [Candidatus Kapabacteria bacterium]